MSTTAGTQAPRDELLDAARGGDSQAFQALVAPHLRALHLHSYRMLGSWTDAEDAVQETMLRAWQGLSGFERRAPLLHWLYRITDHVPEDDQDEATGTGDRRRCDVAAALP